MVTTPMVTVAFPLDRRRECLTPIMNHDHGEAAAGRAAYLRLTAIMVAGKAG